MVDQPEHRGYGPIPGEDVIDKVPGHMNRSPDRDKPPELQAVEARMEMARALWAIAWVLDEIRADVIDGP